MGLLLTELVGLAAGASAVLPLALFRSRLSNQAAWIAAKLWFAVVFPLALLELGGAHG